MRSSIVENLLSVSSVEYVIDCLLAMMSILALPFYITHAIEYGVWKKTIEAKKTHFRWYFINGNSILLSRWRGWNLLHWNSQYLWTYIRICIFRKNLLYYENIQIFAQHYHHNLFWIIATKRLKFRERKWHWFLHHVLHANMENDDGSTK